jgi:oligopeptide ABC transporter, permease protein appC
MSYFDDRTDKDLSNPVHGQGTPGNDARRRSYELNDKYAGKDNTPSEENKPPEEDYSLNDDRRVKVLSPGTLVAKRFFRNRLAVVGLTILAVMFVFSFIGGLISPYGQDEVFYRDDIQLKEYAAMSENTEYRYLVADGQEFGTILQAQLTLHMGKDDSFSYKGVTYDVTKEGDSLYSVSSGGRLLAIAYKDIISANDPSQKFGFNFSFNALKAHANGEAEFTANGKTYTLDEDSVMLNGEEIAYISRFVIQSKVSGTVISKDFKERVQQAVENGETEYTYVNDAGQEREIKLEYNPAKYQWSIKEGTSTRVFDAYSFPNSAHWLGTDKNGMDMLTRLMYGGRVSLMIGFIVVIISAALGVVLGGVSGYFGGWVDNLIMRIVDIFYCIPSTPLIIILGAAMDGMRVDPQIRMLYLMLILGFLGWPGIARLVRGQILSLREQEFMTATEACGISVSRRIFRHLIPNVIPQLIVNCTMSLGSTIITEATLSFLGLGVKFPFASWGNIMNDVSNSYVLTSYWFIWIPAGICLMLTVLGFNFVGDGLRDAFDPKMKR